MPPTTPTATNQPSDSQTMPYPQTSPLATHRPTRPTAVVPPLPKDPTISPPVGSMATGPSMTSSSSSTTSSSNYQQVSPQKTSNNNESIYQKQVNI